MKRRSPHDILGDLNNSVEQAQRALAEYLPPDSGISPEDAINNALGILDDRQFLKLQNEARELVGERPVVFAD